MKTRSHPAISDIAPQARSAARVIASCAALLTAAASVAAGSASPDADADAEDNHQGIGIYIDQDFFSPVGNEDRDYTMGFAVELYRDSEEGDVPILDKTLKFLNGWRDRQDHRATGLRRSLLIGSTTYTPDDLGNPNPIFTDRPYASILFVSLKQFQANATHSVGSDLQFGLIGLDISDQVQTFIHQRYRAISGNSEPVDPEGWGHQISDGGEPTFRYRYSEGQLLTKGRHWYEFSRELGFSVGYQNNAHIGLNGRFGNFTSAFWRLPYDPINRGNGIPATDGDEFYAWSAYRARLVGYDALLQGQFRNSDVTVNSSDIKRLVHEGGIGVTWAREKVALTAALNAKSGEMEGPGDRTHVWGGFYVNFRY